MREEFSFFHKLCDLFLRFLPGNRKRQNRVRNCPIRHLFINRQPMAAPVTARLHRVGSVDHHLCSAAFAFEGQHLRGVNDNVLRP